MKRKMYESPSTLRTEVELEGGICAASANVQNPNEDNGRIEEHQVNTGFDYDFNNQGWDNNVNNN